MYGPDVAAAAEVLWQASGRIGAHRLQPFVPELLDRLLRGWRAHVSPPPSTSWCGRSVAPTLARLLAPARAHVPARGATTTRPGTWLRARDPDPHLHRVGRCPARLLEIDLVAHCGSSTQGFYLCTLCAVDIATTWVELEAVWGKSAGARGRRRASRAASGCPCRWSASTATTASEFINHGLYDCCRRHGITFTRSRAWKKNDSAHVEQKNGAIVRHLVGYDRFASKAAYAQLARVYELARLHVNFFQPVREARDARRARGARTRRVYDRAQTPYQRLCAPASCSAGQARTSSRRSITVSIRSSCGATSTPRSTASGPSPPPTRAARRGIPR